MYASYLNLPLDYAVLGGFVCLVLDLSHPHAQVAFYSCMRMLLWVLSAGTYSTKACALSFAPRSPSAEAEEAIEAEPQSFKLLQGLGRRNNGFLFLCLYGFVAQHFSGKMSRCGLMKRGGFASPSLLGSLLPGLCFLEVWS